jgi:hypothetical protein
LRAKKTKAKYELAVPGTLRILPSKELAEVLRPEYEQMTEIMIFGDAPKFDVVVDALIGLEAQVNG